MKNLIAKLEAATEGSREMDARITALVKGQIFRKWLGHYYTTDEIAGGLGGNERDVPLYTSSIDAALTLVPEGADIDLYVAAHASNTSACAVDILHPETEEKYGTGNNLSTALALCIAALRARQAMESP